MFTENHRESDHDAVNLQGNLSRVNFFLPGTTIRRRCSVQVVCVAQKGWHVY